MLQTKVEPRLVSKSLAPMTKPDRPLFAALQPKPAEGRQRRVMAGALVLLLIALGLLLYKDRDFWFPTDDTQEADELPTPPAPAAEKTTPAQPTLVVATAAPTANKTHSASKPEAKETAAPAQPEPAAPVVATTRRTVLPPLEVEVVAGDTHKTVRPGTNQVHVDLQPGAPPRPVTEAPVSEGADTTAGVTSNAAERVQMSADTVEVVSRPVKPDYPLLARQMKVQGSVILRALIGRDGLIQDLHVESGPPILAGAAEEAVKQWHFKPHYQGTAPVETQAKITVNFTISTN